MNISFQSSITLTYQDPRAAHAITIPDCFAFPSGPRSRPASENIHQSQKYPEVGRSFILSFGMSTSSPTAVTRGFAFAASPNVMYPPKPVNVFMPMPMLDEVGTLLTGSVSSAVDMVSRKNMTCSVVEYARQRTDGRTNAIVLAECGKGAS